MLPSLQKQTPLQFHASSIKLYNPPRELVNFQSEMQKKSVNISSSRANTKIKYFYKNYKRVMAAGFRKQDLFHGTGNKNKAIQTFLQQPNYATLSMHQNVSKMQFAKLSNNSDLSAQIKLIEKKIRYHKKKVQEEKKKKQQMEKQKKDPYSCDFQKIIQHEMQLQSQAGKQEGSKGFDYLTNPGRADGDEQPSIEQQRSKAENIVVPKQFNINAKIQKLERHYEQSLKKKFQRRQIFPHYPCKRKTPKLFVTAKTNALEKFGKKPAQQQHIFRVMTKQCTPQQIYPTIPNFTIVKDNLSKNVMAYLNDFKPFLEKTREQQEESNSLQDNIRVQTGEQSHEENQIRVSSTSNMNNRT